MKDNNIQSFKDVDFSSVSVPFIALFRGPDDYPGKYVARLFDLDKPTNAVMVRDELKEIEEDIKTNTNLVFVERGTEDVKSLLGVWM